MVSYRTYSGSTFFNRYLFLGRHVTINSCFLFNKFALSIMQCYFYSKGQRLHHSHLPLYDYFSLLFYYLLSAKCILRKLCSFQIFRYSDSMYVCRIFVSILFLSSQNSILFSCYILCYFYKQYAMINSHRLRYMYYCIGSCIYSSLLPFNFIFVIELII